MKSKEYRGLHFVILVIGRKNNTSIEEEKSLAQKEDKIVGNSDEDFFRPAPVY